MTRTPTILYADFSCPWSHLAHHRLELLAADGLDVEVRAVEHEPRRGQPGFPAGDDFEAFRDEVARMRQAMLPDEDLPLELRGFVPNTRAAVSAFAESFGAGVADIVAPILFDAYWRYGHDLGNPAIVRTLVADAVMSGHSPSDPLRRWGHAVDVTGGPMTTVAWKLVLGWRRLWTGMEKEVVPILLPEAGGIRYGVDAVEHLGHLVVDRGIDPASEPVRRELGPRPPLDGHGRTQVLYPTPGAA